MSESSSENNPPALPGMQLPFSFPPDSFMQKDFSYSCWMLVASPTTSLAAGYRAVGSFIVLVGMDRFPLVFFFPVHNVILRHWKYFKRVHRVYSVRR